MTREKGSFGLLYSRDLSSVDREKDKSIYKKKKRDSGLEALPRRHSQVISI